MQIFNKETSYNFLGLRKVAMVFSLTLIVIAISAMVVRGFNFGIDFTGGTIIEVGYAKNAELDQIRDLLAKKGYGDAVVQNFGTATDVVIRVAPHEGMTSAQLSEQILSILKAQDESVQKRRVEFVGPQVGEELTNDGGLAMIYSLIGILIYVALRFEYRFAVGSVAALVHDVIITLGLFAIFQLDFDLTVLAAILAVIG
jgi:preprotein translocase subunit SecF